MAFVFTTVSGNVVTITSYTINPAVIYLASKQDHNLGSSPYLVEYPFYVGKYDVAPGEHKIDVQSPNGDFVAVLYGSEDAQPYHILDFSVFVITNGTPCVAPGGVLTKCLDSQTVAVWNQTTCSYDSHVCASGSCVNGSCTTPPGQLRWDCSGAPDYLCTQTTPTGKYATQAECMAACNVANAPDNTVWMVAIVLVVSYFMMRK